MQAVLLLANKGIDYIEHFLKQFDNRFNVYIHNDIKNKLSDEEIEYLKRTYSNIKCILQKIDCKYSDISMIDAELLLIKEALKDKNNKYLHLMSESDYLAIDIDTFYKKYDKSDKQFIYINEMYGTKDTVGVPNIWRIINGKYHYFGSQWFSLTYDLLHEIVNDSRLQGFYDEMQYYCDNKDNDSHRQAVDEAFFQNFIMEFGYKGKYKFNIGIEDSSERFVDWLARNLNSSEKTHPGLFTADKSYSQQQLTRALSGMYTVVRKVDYKNNSCIEQLNKIREINSKRREDFMKVDKLVSVCMCTRNRAFLMLPSIKSILCQTYKNFEFVIVDDDSTDETDMVCKQLMLGYAQIKYHKNESHSYINARNTTLQKAKGEYICFMDSDDMYAPNKIEEQVKYLEEHPDVDVVGCNIKFGKKTSNLSIPKTHFDWDNEYFKEEIKKENISMLLHGPAIMVRRSIIDKVFSNGMYFYPELKNGGEDQVFLYTLYLNGAKFANITSTTYLYNYLEYDDAISATIGQHFNENNFIFKYIHDKPLDERMAKVKELYDKYNNEEQ